MEKVLHLQAGKEEPGAGQLENIGGGQLYLLVQELRWWGGSRRVCECKPGCRLLKQPLGCGSRRKLPSLCACGELLLLQPKPRDAQHGAAGCCGSSGVRRMWPAARRLCHSQRTAHAGEMPSEQEPKLSRNGRVLGRAELRFQPACLIGSHLAAPAQQVLV